jgi:hypothetical protein
MATNKEELLEQWLVETDSSRRELLLKELEARNLIPDDTDYENEYGLYPDVADENFLMKLFHKREFAENKYESIEDLATCSGSVEFELSPVQRFVRNFLSGKTPYNSALLYHGVGVGKTCSAISIAEANLYIYPKNKVYIIAPPNIQPNFLRTIFDINNVIISDDDNLPNIHTGCTGSLYLKLSGTEYEKDIKVIERKVKSLIKTRYEFMGYIQLASYIERIVSKDIFIKDPGRRREEEIKALRKEFSGKIMIIDEAHNLRDIPGESDDDNLDAPGGDVELSDSAQGKKLTPSLTRVVTYANNMKLIFLTATPMYNNYLEIIFLLNLLLLNDKRATIKPTDIFNNKGDFTKEGRIIFGKVVMAYVSYMRGETPISFPIRLNPVNAPTLSSWPSHDPNGTELKLSEMELERLNHLPLVPVIYGEETKRDYIKIVNEAVAESGLGIKSVDTLVQSGNFIFPEVSDSLNSRIRESGFDNVFDDRAHSLRNLTRFTSKIGPPIWLREDNLANYSPKSAFIIKKLRSAKGPAFVYSRFIKSGALPFALALEANGYTPYGKDSDKGLLYDGIQVPDGRQCALCKNREKSHKSSDSSHKFVPAKYVILTGRKNISPNNNESVIAERNSMNYDGSQIKVVIGSQVASEGIDLKFIREIYVFDSWFHLNKMEQVLGRGIRTCSHIHPKISKEERNTTVYLMVNYLSDSSESADLYMYRIGMLKALQTGKVQRVIKEFAIDCNLNINVNMIQGLANTEQIDAQGNKYEKNINDQNYTNLCDWMECKYTCATSSSSDLVDSISDLTYDEFDVRWRETKIKSAIKKLFQTKEENEGLLLIKNEDIRELFSGIPEQALFSVLQDIVNNKSFRLIVNNKEGYLIYKNGFYLFQPIKINYDDIPLSMRISQYPIKQDEFIPVKTEIKVEPLLTEGLMRMPEEIAIKEEEKSFINTLWEAFLSIGKKIESGTLENKFSQMFIELINKKYKSNPVKSNEVLNAFEMVFWLYRGLKDNVDNRKIFAYVFLDYVWDTILNLQEQLVLTKNNNDIINKVAQEQIIQNGKYFRFLNLTEPYEIQYYCGNKICFEAEKNLLNNDNKDPYNKLPPANKTYVGEIYGFIVPKARHLIFKTNVPADSGNSPKGGQECANTTSIKANIEFLYLLGKILRETIRTDFHLNAESLDREKGTHKVKNPSQYCTLREFVLRWMDEKKLMGKRWFYRPISAFKTNHKSRVTKSKI